MFVYKLFPSVLTLTSDLCTGLCIYSYINKFNILPYNFILETIIVDWLFKKSYEGENDGNSIFKA